MPAAVLGCHTSVPALAPVQASPLSPAGSIECAGIAIAEQDGPPLTLQHFNESWQAYTCSMSSVRFPLWIPCNEGATWAPAHLCREAGQRESSRGLLWDRHRCLLLFWLCLRSLRSMTLHVMPTAHLTIQSDAMCLDLSMAQHGPACPTTLLRFPSRCPSTGLCAL